jgi:hypothetical protein
MNNLFGFLKTRILEMKELIYLSKMIKDNEEVFQKGKANYI